MLKIVVICKWSQNAVICQQTKSQDSFRYFIFFILFFKWHNYQAIRAAPGELDIKAVSDRFCQGKYIRTFRNGVYQRQWIHLEQLIQQLANFSLFDGAHKLLTCLFCLISCVRLHVSDLGECHDFLQSPALSRGIQCSRCSSCEKHAGVPNGRREIEGRKF